MKNFFIVVWQFFATLVVNISVAIFGTTMLQQVQVLYKGSWLSFYVVTFDLSKADRVVVKRKTSKLAVQAVELLHYQKFNTFRTYDNNGKIIVARTLDNDNDLFYPSKRSSKVYTLYLSEGNRRCSGSTFTPWIVVW